MPFCINTVFPPLNSFRTCMYCHQRSQYIRLNSKKNSFRGNSSRKYGTLISDEGIHYKSAKSKISRLDETFKLWCSFWGWDGLKRTVSFFGVSLWAMALKKGLFSFIWSNVIKQFRMGKFLPESKRNKTRLKIGTSPWFEYYVHKFLDFKVTFICRSAQFQVWKWF